jgi:hypothetical protein
MNVVYKKQESLFITERSSTMETPTIFQTALRHDLSQFKNEWLLFKKKYKI